MKAGKLSLTILALLSGLAARAQETTGNLEGTVLTAAGEAVGYVDIVVGGPSLLGTRGTAITDEGYFRIPALPPGVYGITLSHVSYQTVSFEEVRVHLGRTTNLGVILMADRVHEMPKVVVAADRPPLIDPDAHALGASLLADDYDLLPVQRDYRSLPTLLPQANESFQGDGTNFAGSTGMENKFFVDGVDTTDPFRGLTGTGLPYNFVQEVQIKAVMVDSATNLMLAGLEDTTRKVGEPLRLGGIEYQRYESIDPVIKIVDAAGETVAEGKMPFG